MPATLVEFKLYASLQPLEQQYQIAIDEHGIEVEITRRSLKLVLNLQENKPIVLGCLKMPSLEVFFDFEGSETDQIVVFWLRSDLCFRRGGSE